ncbi:uncharacterized protein E0L32_001371 [Thyridium curvatum]|uniref:Uncharacterized protein n=1 Tax=Thyridium curvatum TaxID=1093900 RepID=A0A507AUK2_9PEZI|nr:uncharacterized protein E0L32_001371 [Thyridium curvatum]TPX10174.1 hypothetical protein E0L32_001371 [Thyridium curvatum]
MGPPSATAAAPPLPEQHMPLKQKMAEGFKSWFGKALGQGATPQGDMAHATVADIFPRTVPEVDGDDCSHDCESCTVKYPRGFKVEESDVLYGHVKGWETHVLVATGKSDWVRDVEDEKGSVMQAVGKAEKPSNGRLMLSASNIPTPDHSNDYSKPTTVLLLPAFQIIENVTPESVPTLISEFVNKGPTNTSALHPVSLPRQLSAAPPPGSDAAAVIAAAGLASRPCPHSALVLLCSQKTRDARCGQSAPLLRRELERHLRPLGLYRDLDDERPGGVGIYFISHVGGHKYSANVMVYRRPDAFGLDGLERARLAPGKAVAPATAHKRKAATENGIAAAAAAANGTEKEEEDGDVGAGQCIWLARVAPEDCENLVKYTILQGKVVKPARQLRGGFDRAKGLISW